MFSQANDSVTLLPGAVPFCRTQRKEAAKPKTADQEPYRCLIARPAARADLAALAAIAGHVNLASLRTEKNQTYVEQSLRTLAGNLSWQQGLLFLAADLYPEGTGPRELAGNVKLQVGWGGYWKRQRHDRLFNFPGVQTWARHEYLTYHPNADGEYALEFAGLSVLPSHQGKKLSRFLMEAWVLFVLLYQDELRSRIGTIDRLYANLLTADTEGKYPFYEQVVKHLFGGLDYDTVDAYRYARSNARSPILDEFLDRRGDQPQARIMCHLLPEELREQIGLVRDQTVGCRKNLERFGFNRVDKYDALDGGPYFETTLPKLAADTLRQEYWVRRVRDTDLDADTPRRTIAPLGRPMSYFRVARVACRIEGDELLVGAEAYEELLLRHREPVVTLQ